MTNRIDNKFTELQTEGRKGFIPFVTAGDPNLDATRQIIETFSELGAAVIELGVPFSDPMADGVVIQQSSERALRGNVGIAEILEIVRQVRRKTDTPIILFSYYNPLLQYGLEKLCAEAAEAGIDGFLVTDLVPEEAEDFNKQLKTHNLAMIFLIAPTSSDERLQMVAERASGFIYAVSRAGVTGTQENTSRSAQELVERMRKFSDLPVAVGFGISNAEHIKETWRYADAAVVGSAIVKVIEKNQNPAEAVAAVRDFTKRLLPDALR